MLFQSLLSRTLATSLVLTAAVSLSVATTGSAQQVVTGPTAFPASDTGLDGFQLEQATVQDLAVTPDAGNGLLFVVTIDGQAETIRVRPRDVRSANATFVQRDAAGNFTPVPRAPSVTYRGSVVGRPASQAAISYFDGGVRGVVWLDAVSPAWGIDPVVEVDPAAAATTHVVYRTDWLREQGTCGVVADVFGPLENTDPLGTPGDGIGFDVLEFAEIGIECDRLYMSQRGNNTTTAQNNVTSVMNAVNVIYERDVEILFEIVTIVFDVGSDPYTTNSACVQQGPDLLGQFAQEWLNNQGSVNRDVAHLFSGRNFTGSTVGCAVTPSICSNFSSYGISDHVTIGSTVGRTGVVAHELGHNFSSQHCTGGGCRVMCATLGGCSGDVTQFAQVSINQILNYKNSIPCLDFGGAPELTSASPSAVQILAPGIVELTGSNLSDVTEVRMIGNTITDFTVVSDTTIRFEAPRPGNLGSQFVWVFGNNQSSNFLTLNYEITDPPALEAPFANVFADQEPWVLEYGGTPGESWFLFLAVGDSSAVNIPAFGFDFLVNGFLVTQGTFDNLGLASFSYTRTDPSALFISLFGQVLVVDPALTDLRSTMIESTLFL